MVNRTAIKRIQNSKKSILLLGPRQVGKSTLCRGLNPDLVINLADEALFLKFSKDPERLKREIDSIKRPSIILIDEIQRVPSLLNSIQAYLDQHSKTRFILTGSSARKLKRGGANLLPGRIILEYLDPLSIWELGNKFKLEKALNIGSLPGIYLDEAESNEVLSTYVQVYLKEEIQAEALSRNIGSFARFLDAAAEASGQWINYSKLASDTETPKETIRRYYEILEDTLIVHRVPPFQLQKNHRRLSQRDRFFFFDVGVRNSILGLVNQNLPLSEKGKLFEQWIVLQVIGFIHAHKKSWKVSSFRTDTGLEVDLIIETPQKNIAVECKYSQNVGVSDLVGLQAFEKLSKKKCEKIVLNLSTRRQLFPTKERVVHFQDFLLKELPKIS
ncbi:MAG: ATP-binding protein [Elusimicrobiota bacterium]